MRSTSVLALVCAIVVAVAGADNKADGEAEGVFQYQIFQSFAGGSSGDEEWTLRGTVELNFPQLLKERGRHSSSDDDGIPIARGGSGSGAANDKASSAVKFQAFEFDSAQFSTLKKLALSGGYYRVRLQRTGTATATAGAVVASVPACSLVASNLRELWTFQSDAYGHISAIDYAAPITASCATDPARAIASASSSALKVIPRGKISFGRSGEKVRGARAGVQLPQNPAAQGETEAAAAAAANKPEEKSFFSKYWMYIVPFVLMMLLQGGQAGAADAAGGAGGGGGGARRARSD